MARIILTNNKDRLKIAVERNINAGFNDYAKQDNKECFLAVHKKRIKKVENCFKHPEGDFCCVVGTCIYRETIGLEALKKVYNDFSGDVENIRKNAVGNYLIAIRKNNRVVCFVDKYQILKTYYFHIGKDWFITNSLADIGNVLDDIKLHEYSFLQETMLGGAIGTQSIFDNVFRLFGHQYIEIDCLKNSFTIKEIPYSRERRNFEGRTIESVVSEYAEIIKSKFNIVANCWGGNVRIHQTGGLDNRTVFSSFMSVGCKPKIMYGVGNSVLIHTKNEDLLICKEYQKKFDLDFYEMNWREDCLSGNQHWQHVFERYGFRFNIYAGSRNFFQEYEGKIPGFPDFMECGYFGENLRLREWAYNSGKTTFSLDDFVEGYLLGGAYVNFDTNKAAFPNYDTFKEHIANMLKGYISLYQIGEDNQISLNDFDQVRWIHSRNSDSEIVNFLNDFAPSIAMFSLPELHEFTFDVPAIWRANAKFQIMLIGTLCPEALNVPFFSHCQKQRFNKKTYFLSPEISFGRLASRLLKKCGISTYTHDILKNVYKSILSSRGRREVLEEAMLKKMIVSIIKEESEKNGAFIDPERYKGSIVYLMRYSQYLYGVRLLKERITK